MSRRRRRLSSDERAELVVQVAARDGWWCVWCGRPLDVSTATLDHWITMSAGGNHDLVNLRLACSPCNHRRGDVPAATWVIVAIHDLMSIGLYWRPQPETSWVPLAPASRPFVGTMIDRGFGDRPDLHDELGGRVVASMILENGPKAHNRKAIIHRRAMAAARGKAFRDSPGVHDDTRWQRTWGTGTRPPSPGSRRAGRTEID